MLALRGAPPGPPPRPARLRAALPLALALAAGACGDPASPTGDTSADTAPADVADAAATDAAPPADATTSDPLAACAGLPADVSGLTLAGDGRFRTLTGLTRPADLHERGVRIFLPASYDASPERRYPVLYMHDERNLFDRSTASYGVEWGVDEVVDQLVGQGEIDEIIVVGVDHSDERIADYTPSADPEYGGGKGALYVRWLATTLKPAIDTLLRTRCEREVTGLAGSSLGGLISFWAGLEWPLVFGRVGAVSPSLWWNGRELLTAFEAHTGPLPARLWIDMGTAEDDYDPATDGPLPPSVADVRQARDRALALGATLGAELGYLEAFGWQHNESAWRQRLPAILRYLYGPLPLPAPDTLTLRAVTSDLAPTGPRATQLGVETRHGARGRLTWPNAAATFGVTAGAALTVSADGLVEAVAPGAATVRATLGDLSAELPLTVRGPR